MFRRTTSGIVALGLLIVCGVLTAGCPGAQTQEPPMQPPARPPRYTLEQAIAAAPSAARRKALEQFKAQHGARDRFRVTDHPEHYEIIVSHPSGDGFSGGAEQYFVDKETGQARMGWHEHPVELGVEVEEVETEEAAE